MPDSLKKEADALAVGLEVGALDISEVLVWVNAVIEREEHPHWSLCELATMGASYVPDVVRALRDVPGTADRESVLAEVVRWLARCLAQDRTRADRVARALYRLALNNRLPEGELLSVAWWAEDALDPSDQGYVTETRDQVIDRMLIVLDAAASSARA